MDFTKELPDDCLRLIISLTSPRDACRLALVSPALKSVADSDAVWERFLPCDYQEIISASSSPSLLSRGKKDLYFHLSFHPILIANGSMSFQLEKESGKKCYMLAPRALTIECHWGDIPLYWEWKSFPDSRFSEVAEFKAVWWLEIKGKIGTRILSSRTNYAAYLVFKLNTDRDGFRSRTVDLHVNVEGIPSGGVRSVFLDPPEDAPQQVQERADRWKEIEMGEFFNGCGDDRAVGCSLREVEHFNWKQGLIIEGIELRPKEFRRKMDFTKELPDDCLRLIISLTSPIDACRLALVSPALKSVADSDAVWERFLPCDYEEIISGSSSSSLLSWGKKDLYFHLSFHPILIANGSMSFQLEKESGKKCFMLGARALSNDAINFWEWTSLQDSRFSEVTKLIINRWLDVKGKIGTRILSPRTNYAAYLVFKLTMASDGFRCRTVDLHVNVEGTPSGEVRSVFLDPPEDVPQQVQERAYGWKEIEMGEFFNGCGDDRTVECSLREVKKFHLKQGLIIEGIELRPKGIGR